MNTAERTDKTMTNKIMGDLSPAERLLKGNNAEAEKPATKPKAESKPKKAAQKKQPPKTDKKPKRTYRLNLALREDIGEAIKAEAEAQSRSTNNLIEMILTEYLERR